MAVIVDKDDMQWIAERVLSDGALSVSLSQRRDLAAKAFRAMSDLGRSVADALAGISAEQVSVLVIGSGGREHAIVSALADSKSVAKVYVAPGNGGTERCGPKVENTSLDHTNQQAVVRFAQEKEIGLIMVGPEQPLVDGLADACSAAGIPCFGPTAAAARLEGSKAFSKDFMQRHSIPTARYATFTDFAQAKAYLEAADHKVVVKASGLAAGKGVVLPQSTEEGVQALQEMMLNSQFGAAGAEVVIEECLEGEEVSVLAFCDGTRSVIMPGAQDHKRVNEGDQGLNTGGMGAYAPAPCLTKALQREAKDLVDRTVQAMAAEGTPYVGVLYMGLMLTASGPMVLEYNCRFGDPETQVLLPLLESDLYDVCMACVSGTLSEHSVEWKDGFATTVVAAAPGYPQAYPKNLAISGVDAASSVANAYVYHAGTKEEGGVLKTSGGRVLAVTGTGMTLRSALSVSYDAMEKLSFEGMHYRRDIAWRALNSQSNLKVLVVGSGGREHAIAHKFASSERVGHVYVAPGNGGTSTDSRMTNVQISAADHDAIIAFVNANNINLVMVGPEQPLVDGLADACSAAGIPCFGPTAAAARLEGSKAFSKDFMQRHSIPTARYATFTDFAQAKAYLEAADHKVVVKASGLAAGKGVVLPQSTEEGVQALQEMMLNSQFGAAGAEVVIEECLEGEEVSVLAFCDGTRSVIMPGAQDHKRVNEGDQGLNTGGMGAYAPAPCLTKALQREAKDLVDRTVQAMAAEGTPYVGVLYMGLMLTASGPMVLEYNCRFGDPETQVLLPLLESDLYDVCMACVSGTLSEHSVEWKDGFATTVVAAAPGYPQAYPKNLAISGVDAASSVANAYVYHAGTKEEGGVLKTSGGRVLAVTGTGMTLRSALSVSYDAMEKLSFEGMHYRRDIAWRALEAPLRVGVLGSTRGSTMQVLIDAIAAQKLHAEIVIVVSNKKDTGILDRAARHGIQSVYVPSKGKTRVDYDLEVSAVLKEAGVELVLLIGYMRILSGAFVKQWENRCLNVHPSLLPEFAGGMDLAVHEAVIAAGRTKSGCTVHFVTEEVDGGPIAVQLECPVEAGDTPQTLKERVQPLEGDAFMKAIEAFRVNEIGPGAHADKLTYAAAGVSIDAGNRLVELIKPSCKATRRPGCDADLGGFGGLFDLDAAGYTGADTILVGATDGVGTKLRVAQIAGIHDYVGIDLVAMCVNDLIVAGAEPLFFLDYYATGRLNVDEAAAVVKGIAEGCVQSNCGLIGGETAEMPSMYDDGDYDLAGFAVGAMKRGDTLPKGVGEGDVLIGLKSSGCHSNGFSLVRKIVEREGKSYAGPCPWDASKTLGEALLTPTKIYVRTIMPMLKRGLLKAMAHITGGGLTENLPRVMPDGLKAVVDAAAAGWTLPPVFQWLVRGGNLDQDEAIRTFNCGVGMVLVVEEANVPAVCELLEQASPGEGYYMLGKFEARQEGEEQVQVRGRLLN